LTEVLLSALAGPQRRMADQHAEICGIRTPS
jgi:hypothetical protein